MAPVNGREKKAFCMKRRRRDRAPTALFWPCIPYPGCYAVKVVWLGGYPPTLTLYKPEWKAVKNGSLALCGITDLLCRSCFVVMVFKGAGIIKVKVKGEN